MKIRRVLKCFMNFEKEEKWLNEMAQKGFALVGKDTSYGFIESEPEDAIIRIDYRTFKTKRDFIDYCTLFEDSGWKHVAGTKNSGAQYFKKIDASGNDDIFSDVRSKAGRYQRYSHMWFTMALCMFPIFVALAVNHSIDLSAFANPKALYYTPGLWEKTGFSFWFSFLFETPFAIGRGFIWMLLPVMILLYIGFSIKAKLLYRRAIKS